MKQNYNESSKLNFNKLLDVSHKMYPLKKKLQSLPLSIQEAELGV